MPFEKELKELGKRRAKALQMGVSGPRVVEMALGEEVSDEELGGWKVHSEITGNVDRVVENEEDCFDIIRQYLAYKILELALRERLMPEYCVANQHKILTY